MAIRLEDYEAIPYRRRFPAIAGCYTLMETREAALVELNQVFAMIADEHRAKGRKLPADSTEIVSA